MVRMAQDMVIDQEAGARNIDAEPNCGQRGKIGEICLRPFHVGSDIKNRPVQLRPYPSQPSEVPTVWCHPETAKPVIALSQVYGDNGFPPGLEVVQSLAEHSLDLFSRLEKSAKLRSPCAPIRRAAAEITLDVALGEYLAGTPL